MPCLARTFVRVWILKFLLNAMVNIISMFDIDLRPMFLVKQWRNLIINVMVMVQVQYCGVNDGFWIQRATQSFFISNPQPHRRRHVLAPREQSDPATLPTLIFCVLWYPSTSTPPVFLIWCLSITEWNNIFDTAMPSSTALMSHGKSLPWCPAQPAFDLPS